MNEHNIANNVKDGLKARIDCAVARLDYADIDGTEWVKLSEVVSAIMECE